LRSALHPRLSLSLSLSLSRLSSLTTLPSPAESEDPPNTRAPFCAPFPLTPNPPQSPPIPDPRAPTSATPWPAAGSRIYAQLQLGDDSRPEVPLPSQSPLWFRPQIGMVFPSVAFMVEDSLFSPPSGRFMFGTCGSPGGRTAGRMASQITCFLAIRMVKRNRSEKRFPLKLTDGFLYSVPSRPLRIRDPPTPAHRRRT